MNAWLLVGIFVALVVVIILVVYWFHTTSVSTTHSLAFNNQVIYASTKPIESTSDGVATIFYATPTGIYAFDTKTKETSLYSPLLAKGLAFSKNLLVLDTEGNFFNFGVSKVDPVSESVTMLYSTVTGFAINAGQGLSYNGGKSNDAKGNFGLVQYTVL